MLFSWWFQEKSVILAASNIKYKGMEENRYKITEDNAAAGMVAEPTPVVRPPLSVQEMRHSLMDAIYSSKDIQVSQVRELIEVKEVITPYGRSGS